MYPLHKFVPLPFGTYMMHIDQPKKRIDVESIPGDIQAFKKQLVDVPARKPLKPRYNFSPVESKKDKKQKASIFDESPSSKTPLPDKLVEPSYHMRYLVHKSQVITEQPPDLTLVDKVTGASVTSPAPWARGRPRRWKEVVKQHEIHNWFFNCAKSKFYCENCLIVLRNYAVAHLRGNTDHNYYIYNPHQTCTVPLPTDPQFAVVPQRHLPAGYRSVEMPHGVGHENPKQVQQPATSHRIVKQQRLDSEMLPHLHKPLEHSRETERRQAREMASRKRRKKVDRIMRLVDSKAQVARIRSSSMDERSATTSAGTRTRLRLSGMGHLLPSRGSKIEGKMRTIGEVMPDRSGDWRKSHKEMETLREIPFEAKDWNPKADQNYMNHVVLERLSNAVPYKSVYVL